MIQFVSAKHENRKITTHYRVKQSSHGRDGITVSHDMYVETVADMKTPTKVTMELDSKNFDTVSGAIDNLVTHLKLMTEALQNREIHNSIPIFKT